MARDTMYALDRLHCKFPGASRDERIGILSTVKECIDIVEKNEPYPRLWDWHTVQRYPMGQRNRGVMWCWCSKGKSDRPYGMYRILRTEPRWGNG